MHINVFIEESLIEILTTLALLFLSLKFGMCEYNIYPNSLFFQKTSIDKTQQNTIQLYRKKLGNDYSLETHELVMDFPCLKNRFLAYLF